MNATDRAHETESVHDAGRPRAAACVPAPAIKDGTLRMIAWARLWSPLSDEATLRQAWEALALPIGYDAAGVEFWNTFHAGVPQPPVPLQLHALPGADGSALRETMLRIAEHLEVETSGPRLPPDHLALACELLGLAAEREEPVLVAGLMQHCIAPWAEAARAAMPNDRGRMALLLQAFLDDAHAAGE